jgi:hypothetical protein
MIADRTVDTRMPAVLRPCTTRRMAVQDTGIEMGTQGPCEQIVIEQQGRYNRVVALQIQYHLCMAVPGPPCWPVAFMCCVTELTVPKRQTRHTQNAATRSTIVHRAYHVAPEVSTRSTAATCRRRRGRPGFIVRLQASALEPTCLMRGAFGPCLERPWFDRSAQL